MDKIQGYNIFLPPNDFPPEEWANILFVSLKEIMKLKEETLEADFLNLALKNYYSSTKLENQGWDRIKFYKYFKDKNWLERFIYQSGLKDIEDPHLLDKYKILAAELEIKLMDAILPVRSKRNKISAEYVDIEKFRVPDEKTISNLSAYKKYIKLLIKVKLNYKQYLKLQDLQKKKEVFQGDFDNIYDISIHTWDELEERYNPIPKNEMFKRAKKILSKHCTIDRKYKESYYGQLDLIIDGLLVEDNFNTEHYVKFINGTEQEYELYQMFHSWFESCSMSDFKSFMLIAQNTKILNRTLQILFKFVKEHPEKASLVEYKEGYNRTDTKIVIKAYTLETLESNKRQAFFYK